MGDYQVEVNRRASSELEDLDPRLARRILEAIEGLSIQPRPRQARKLVGSEDSYRIRVGTYRVLYQIDDSNNVVRVFAVGHRRDIYRRGG